MTKQTFADRLEALVAAHNVGRDHVHPQGAGEEDCAPCTDYYQLRDLAPDLATVLAGEVRALEAAHFVLKETDGVVCNDECNPKNCGPAAALSAAAELEERMGR